MNTFDWIALRDRLLVTGRRMHELSPDAVARAEAAFGVALPADYLAFGDVFGPGDLSDGFYIACPGTTFTDANVRSHFDLVALDADLRDICAEYEDISDGALGLGRLRFFCRGAYSDYFAWEVSEGVAGHVVHISRDFVKARVADTFGEFVTRVVLADSLGLREYPSEQTFAHAAEP